MRVGYGEAVVAADGHAGCRGPALDVVAPAPGGAYRQPDQVGSGGVAGPAVHGLLPLQRDAGAAPARAEQGARDRRDGVGVRPGPHRRLQGEAEVLRGETVPGGAQFGDGGADDRRPGGLERVDDPAVVGEVVRRIGLRLVQPLRPRLAALGGEQVQAGAHAVEGSVQHRGADAGAPQHAGIGTVGVRVGERADGDGGLGHLGGVTEMAEGDDPGAHQRAVPRAAIVAGGETAGGGQHRRARRSGGTGSGAQDGAGLGADVTGAAAQPALEVGGYRVKGPR